MLEKNQNPANLCVKLKREPTNPDAALLDAVLIFYRELGIRPGTVQKIASSSMSKHRNAMRRAMSHVLSEHFGDQEVRAILGVSKPE